ncbi:advillin-like [Haliotis asinina]|uniref:advillin-like n=1 Tax=Haliotis asinina TaxID=109174 RepID=UPI0035319B13
MAAYDEAFAKAGQTPGLEIWRIEKLKVVPQDVSTYGTFYTGDSYIVLSTKQVPNSNKYQWDVHFWLGDTTSQDEQGVAAYKTVELDDSLGGAPVQHREVQDHESQLFLSYFKKGIRYLDGGVDSGFKKVERDKYETRLLHIKGKRNVRVRQVKCDVSSLNQGDVFILDCGLIMYVWNGPASSKMERIKAAEVAKTIKDEERGGRATINIIDDRWDCDPKFFNSLGCLASECSIKSADEGGDDREFERVAQDTVTLYRVTDASGSLEVNEVASKPLKREDLDSNDCFILDSGPSGIYVWIGKKCTGNEKKSAWQRATDFLSMRGYPEWTSITQVVEGGETPLFKQYFSTWISPNTQRGLGQVYKTNRIAKYSNEKFDVTGLHKKASKSKKDFIPDNGMGMKQIWRIEQNSMVILPEEMHGVFYTGDCYIILYTYKVGNKENYIIYFWQGSKSTIDERGGSAILAQRLDDTDLNGRAVQIRVVQGQEPEHFLRLFSGKMIIFLGGINNAVEEGPVKVYHIRGTNEFNTRAIQVPPRAASLNSNDVFVLETEVLLYLWIGKGASEEERTVARQLLDFLFPNRSAVEIPEEDEPLEFWDTLGGKEAYATGKRLQTSGNDMPPRLFQCSNASGRFLVEEIVNFSQEDLVEDDVMLLDTFDEIFVWIGKGANEVERKESLSTAMEYIRTDPAGRTPDNTLIMQIKQGFEPLHFTGHFHAWDPDKWSYGKSYEDMKRELGRENVAATRVQEELACYDQTYTYEELTRRLVPRGVDVTNKEKYLSDEEFKKIFKITKHDYLSKPKWRQLEMKKRVGLF